MINRRWIGSILCRDSRNHLDLPFLNLLYIQACDGCVILCPNIFIPLRKLKAFLKGHPFQGLNDLGGVRSALPSTLLNSRF